MYKSGETGERIFAALRERAGKGRRKGENDYDGSRAAGRGDH